MGATESKPGKDVEANHLAVVDITPSPKDTEKGSAPEAEDAIHTPSMECSILGKYPMMLVVICAGCGVITGVCLSEWEPSDTNDKVVALRWVGLVGDMFIRMLKAIVLPLVFANALISVTDMIQMGHASSVGWKTIGLFTLTSLTASIVGLLSIVAYRSKFSSEVSEPPDNAFVSLACNMDGYLVTEMADGSLACMMGAREEDTQFVINDTSGRFATVQKGARDDISLSDTIYDGVFTKLITSNIFFSLVDSNFAAVILFAIFAGVALGEVLYKRKQAIKDNMLCNVLVDVSEMFLLLINSVIKLTPFAVFSLIANAVGSQKGLTGAFSNVGWLVVASLTGFLAHFLVAYILVFYLFTGWNPIEYLSHVVPAQVTAFSSASSVATLPVTLRCVKSTGKVPDMIRNFICPLGLTLNMDGNTVYFPCACMWLAYVNKVDVNASHYILLLILSMVSGVGTAPVPSASFVLIITAYNTIFGGTGTPNGFELIVAIDWFLDRFTTVLNITGDTVVSAIISANVPLDNFEAPETPWDTSTEESELKNEETNVDGPVEVI